MLFVNSLLGGGVGVGAGNLKLENCLLLLSEFQAYSETKPFYIIFGEI